MEKALALAAKGQLYEDQGDYKKAELYFSQALAIKESILGVQHPELAEDLHNLGLLNYVVGGYDRAEILLNRALRLKRKVFNHDHPDVLETLAALALVKSDMALPA